MAGLNGIGWLVDRRLVGGSGSTWLLPTYVPGMGLGYGVCGVSSTRYRVLGGHRR